MTDTAEEISRPLDPETERLMWEYRTASRNAYTEKALSRLRDQVRAFAIAAWQRGYEKGYRDGEAIRGDK